MIARSQLWSHFHLSTFQGIIMFSKGVPVDPISKRGMWASQVLSVKIGPVTAIVPPGSFVFDRTGSDAGRIVVAIFGAKLHTTIN